ncbi:MAG: hypothetical protein WB729_15260 [Candidatus Sulfotelmatobacter sp.]
MTWLSCVHATRSRPVNKENRTKRLYQWLTQRASFFHFAEYARGTSRTVRTEVTFERESITLSVNGPALDPCPMCGRALPPPQGEQTGLRLEEGLTNRNFD